MGQPAVLCEQDGYFFALPLLSEDPPWQFNCHPNERSGKETLPAWTPGDVGIWGWGLGVGDWGLGDVGFLKADS